MPKNADEMALDAAREIPRGSHAFRMLLFCEAPERCEK